jgi:hypothetical protein
MTVSNAVQINNNRQKGVVAQLLRHAKAVALFNVPFQAQASMQL